MSRCTVDDWALQMPDRKQNEVRRILEGPHPFVPPDLVGQATRRGHRLVQRRNALHILTVLLVTALTVFLVVVAIVQARSHGGPPADPPPLGF